MLRRALVWLGLLCYTGLPSQSNAADFSLVRTAFAVVAVSQNVFAMTLPVRRRQWNDSLIWPAPQREVYDRMRSYNSSVPILRALYASDWKWEYNVSHNDPTDGTNHTVWMDILKGARDRFKLFLDRGVPKDIDPSNFDKYYPVNPSSAELVPLSGIRLSIRNTSDTDLYYGLDESYEIDVNDPSTENISWIEISATNVYGAMHGLETLKQLLQFGWSQGSGNSQGATNTSVYILRNSTFKLYIYDAPVYSYRGIMIDTSRHYLPLSDIVLHLQVMASNKLNVLHWHLTDSQSFPYLSDRFPELAIHGAYCYPECVYNVSQIRTVIDHASLLGIRVIVELDLPGHSQAIGLSHPEFLSLCYGQRRSEPLDVTNPAVYKFVHDLYAEITHVFTDSWIHVGGDEVSLDCWKNSSVIQKWMVMHNMSSELEILQFFELDLLYEVIQKNNKRPIVWQDLFDDGIQGLPNNTIIDIWKDWVMEGSLFNATNATFDVVFSACWYLDHLNQDWWSFYRCNPRNFANLSSVQQAHVLGGHSSMWGETVDISNFFERVWPRSSATAEVLWSGSPRDITKDLSNANVQDRLVRFRCYMIQQFGVSISPISPGHCQSHGPIVLTNTNIASKA